MSEITDRVAKLNREAWNFTRRQRDEGRVKIRNDSAADILAGKNRLPPEILSLAGDVKGKRLLDLIWGVVMLQKAPNEWARLGADVVG